ncbi:MAG: nucleotide exchange factor GrpE [Nakamurella sp.]
MSGYGAEGAQGEEPEPIIRDKRRIDPATGKLREPGGFPGNPFSGKNDSSDPADPNNAAQPLTVDLSAAELDLAKQEAAERTADLQRVTAEYANYRKRVDRDRESVVTAAKASVVLELLTVLDDLDRARAHGDLVGSFGAVADKLLAALTKLGLTPVGKVGDPFDPAVHEAVQFDTSTEVSEPTVTAIFRSGYSLGERLVRPAVVVVTGPEHENSGPEKGSIADGPIIADEAFGSATAGEPGERTA